MASDTEEQTPRYDYFHRPPFSRINQGRTPGKNPPRLPNKIKPVPINLVSDDEDDNQAKSQLEDTLHEWTGDTSVPHFENYDDNPEVSSEQPFHAASPVSFESIRPSQRTMINGKEVVKSSDDEDTESVDSFDAELFNQPTKHAPKGPITASWSAPNLLKMVPPPVYKNSLDSLVNATRDDNETEAKVVELKSMLEKGRRLEDGGQKNRETVLKSALGGNDNDRLHDALRRTEALDQERTWSFLDESPMTPTALQFPGNLLGQGTYMLALQDPASRARTFQSGILEFTASITKLPDELIIWLFKSVSIEPLQEPRQAYCRILEQVPSAHISPLIRPYDIIDLFRHLGAKPSALNLMEPIVQDSPEELRQVPRLKDRSILLSIFKLLRSLAESFSPDTLATAIQILFRMTLDELLTEDGVVGSELQNCLSGLLESVPDKECENMALEICTVAFKTITDAEFQSRLLQYILPTTTWISLLRFRLAVSFLIRSPSPLTESPNKVLDLRRLTSFLAEDDRFNESLSMAKRAEYDYGELAGLVKLLEVVVNTSLLDLNYRQEKVEKQFNSDIDKLSFQIKRIFVSIEDSGASNLKRYVAKETLDALRTRVLYSVRTKPPPRKPIFQASEIQNRKIDSMLFKEKWQSVTDMPIRVNDE